MKVGGIKLCPKCYRTTTVGFCDGCGEYASHGKCECEKLSKVPTIEEVRRMKRKLVVEE